MRLLDNYTKKRLSRHYELRRQRAERERDLIVDNLKIKYPELEQLEAEYIQAGIGKIKNEISGGSDQADYDLKLAEQRLNEFLIIHEIPFAYSDPQYECKLCQDRGWLDNGYCSCVERALIAINQQEGILVPPANLTFDNYNVDVYSNEKNQNFYNGKVSVREYMRSVKAFSLQYIENFNEQKDNLFLFGHPGTGKTFLMSSIAHELRGAGNSVVYIRANRLFAVLTKQRVLYNSFSPDPVEVDASERMQDLLYKSDLLCIDDIGIYDKGVINIYPDLIVLLDERLNAGFATIMTSNLNPAKLAEDHDKRIESRITGNYELILFEGLDVRKSEAGKKQGIIRE